MNAEQSRMTPVHQAGWTPPRAVAAVFILFFSAARAEVVLEYSTFLDGSGGELIRDIEHDAEGNIYVTGGTYSADFPTTTGAYQTVLNPGTTPPGTTDGTFEDMDVFVTKFAPDGQIIWSTLLGGPQYDRAYAIELDDSGNVYVGGRAGPGFPVTSGAIGPDYVFDTVAASSGYGDQDAFIAKLSPDGGTLLWATYLSSPAPTLMRDFRVDRANGRVHCGINRVAGSFAHITTGALQNTVADDNDAAYVQLDADDGSLVYGTLIGGDGDDYRPSLVTDGQGGVYFMLQSDSTDLPAPSGGFAQGPNGGADFVVYHFDSAHVPVAATHFGGTGDELTETHSIARDGNGFIFLGGGTSSSALPSTNGSAQPGKAGLNDGFVAKLTADLTQVLASTYFGGTDGDGGEGVAIGPDDTVFIAGPVKSTDLPTTADALVPSFPGGGRNGVLTRFSNDLTNVLYSTYIGGSDDDDARIAHVTDGFAIYVGGIARSDDFPVQAAIDSNQTGNFSAFLMKFSLSDNQAPSAVATASLAGGDQPLSVTLDGSGSSDPDGSVVAYQWAVGSQILGTNATEMVTLPAGSHFIELTVTDDLGGIGTDTVIIDVRDPDPDPDLVAWWRFDELSGLVAADSSGNGHAGTLENFAGTEWESGKIGGGLRIEDATERVRVPHAAALNLDGAFSIVAWTNVDQIPFFGRVVVKGGEADGWGLVIPNAPKLNAVYGGTGYATSNNVLAAASWQHIGVTHDGVSLRYYVNGVLQETRDESLSALPNMEPVLIGNHPSLARPLGGVIDELRLYSRVLVPLEIAAMANQGTIDTDGDHLADDRDPDDDDDRLPDAFETSYGFDPLVPDDADLDHDDDTFSTRSEYEFDTSPINALDRPPQASIQVGEDDLTLSIDSKSSRRYTLHRLDRLLSGSRDPVPGHEGVAGNDGVLLFVLARPTDPRAFFSIEASPP